MCVCVCVCVCVMRSQVHLSFLHELPVLLLYLYLNAFQNVSFMKDHNNTGYCHRLFFTTCHCLSLTIYLSLYLSLLERTSIVSYYILFAGKSKHHLDLVDTCFTPMNFYIHGYGSQVKVHPGAHACGFHFQFHHERTGHNQL